VRHEEDGDLHVLVDLDASSRRLIANGRSETGALTVEFMPRDGGHLPEPSPGARIALTGAWVFDSQHDWNELHPVWTSRVSGGKHALERPPVRRQPARRRLERSERHMPHPEREQLRRLRVGTQATTASATKQSTRGDHTELELHQRPRDVLDILVPRRGAELLRGAQIHGEPSRRGRRRPGLREPALTSNGEHVARRDPMPTPVEAD
jgi:hypothetical protein